MKWNPRDYAQNSNAQLKWARELRSRLSLHGSESILDVGCGDGKITADFAEALPNGQVMGIDSSQEMIAYAQETYSISNLSFACVDARSLNFANQFDLIFSNAVLHWVDNHPAFLQGAYRALNSNGRLITSCGGAGGAIDILDTFAQIVAQNPWHKYFPEFRNPYHFYGTTEYEPWLKAAGFNIDRLELVPKDMTHSGESGLASWFRTTWLPFTQAVPESDRDRFISEVTQTYLAKFPLDANGFAHVQMVRLEVEAHR
ncbi:methyltransferase domain-containing protein [Leptolyngbya sp. NIES-2104]|uniref:methyltransferase domain-containing protein n=1 Tax=Leptolyngbya sp. NIES-2104 TaxID=1552121 RepID=UPI0006EC8753|nr:methyltransferase domain-containing protein [Leptolyngbya sp. NIES-2104]GAP94751.1 trans-aconitate 2-methyltransferase [Leptolyngbya sp. NIES-2104]